MRWSGSSCIGQGCTQVRAVDDVVVDERRHVDELDRHALDHGLVAVRRGREERQRRAQPLAARGNDVARKLRNQRHRALHALEDQRIDRLDILRHETGEGSERRTAHFLAFFAKTDDDGQIGLPRLNPGAAA